MRPRRFTSWSPGRFACGFVALAVLTGCVHQVAVPGGGRSVLPTPAFSPTDGRLVASATVLDSGSGPELCVGGVASSLPPQCGGPRIDHWVWPKQGTERQSGVTWGAFFVVGTYDGKRFAFEKVITAAEAAASLPADQEPDFATPCPEPAGGWRPPDPARATQEDQQRAFALAERLPGYGGSWIDDRGDDAQNPLTTVVNVRVTGDAADAERQLRTVWGGPLCVSKAEHSQRELKPILDSVMHRRDFLSGSYSWGFVDLHVSYDDGTLQRQLDDRYGTGLVHVTSALRPYRA